MLFNNKKDQLTVLPCVLQSHCKMYLLSEEDRLVLLYDATSMTAVELKCFVETHIDRFVSSKGKVFYGDLTIKQPDTSKYFETTSLVVDHLLKHILLSGIKGRDSLPSAFIECLKENQTFFKMVSLSPELHNDLYRKNFSPEFISYLKAANVTSCARMIVSDYTDYCMEYVALYVLNEVLCGNIVPHDIEHLLHTRKLMSLLTKELHYLKNVTMVKGNKKLKVTA